MLIFGREPAVIVGLIQAATAVLGRLFFDWDFDTVAVVVAVEIAVLDTYVAWATKDTLLGVAIGLLKALAVAGAAFGHSISADTLAQLIALLTAGLAFFQRTQTFPLGAPPVALPGATAVSNIGSA